MERAYRHREGGLRCRRRGLLEFNNTGPVQINIKVSRGAHAREPNTQNNNGGGVNQRLGKKGRRTRERPTEGFSELFCQFYGVVNREHKFDKYMVHILRDPKDSSMLDAF